MAEYWYNLGLVIVKVEASCASMARTKIAEFYKDKFNVDVIVNKYEEILDGQWKRGLPDVWLEKCVPAFYLPFKYSLLDRTGLPASWDVENINSHRLQIFDKYSTGGCGVMYWGSMNEYPKASPMKALRSYINSIESANKINANVRRYGLDRAFMDFCSEYGYEIKDYMHAMQVFKGNRRLRKRWAEMSLTDVEAVRLTESVDTLNLILSDQQDNNAQIRDGLGNWIDVPFFLQKGVDEIK